MENEKPYAHINKDGNKAGLEWGTPLPFMSQLYNLSPSPSQTRVGACWWVLILIYRKKKGKKDKPIPTCSNSDMYFCLDGKDDFPKTNNITSIHKILNEQIHKFHAYTLFWKKSIKHYKNFKRSRWPSERKYWEKKWMDLRQIDSHLEHYGM